MFNFNFNFKFMFFFFPLSIFGAVKKEWSQSILKLVGILGGQKKTNLITVFYNLEKQIN